MITQANANDQQNTNLLRAAIRMRDALTVDGDPPCVDIPEGADPKQFTGIFDDLASAIRAITSEQSGPTAGTKL